MAYEVKSIGEKLLEEIKNKRYSIESFAELLSTSRQTLSNQLKNDMPLSTFLNACEKLDLSPAAFFNTGNIQNAINNKGINQSINNSTLELELLKQENKYLKEKVELLERLLKATNN
ncbi:hypothetical protein [Emticicia sp. 17c]|uniref:hypothetical protein n=1 Tax=Emticicia sp. 17c TaxID=3127704 RepID=UPI00301C2EA7